MTRHEEAGFDPALYEADFFAWTQRQAAALRALPPDDRLDIDHVAAEIEDLGKRDLREVNAYLARLIEHLLKIHAAPSSRDRPHWWAEAVHFQAAAVAAFTPGMRQLIDLDRAWARGGQAARPILAEHGPPLGASAPCPFSLETLLADDFDIEAALAGLDEPSPRSGPSG